MSVSLCFFENSLNFFKKTIVHFFYFNFLQNLHKRIKKVELTQQLHLKALILRRVNCKNFHSKAFWLESPSDLNLTSDYLSQTQIDVLALSKKTWHEENTKSTVFKN